jgi:hypothetical protein
MKVSIIFVRRQTKRLTSVPNFAVSIIQFPRKHRRASTPSDGVTDSSLRQSLGVSTNKGFGPILTGISRRAKKAGVSLQDILTSEKVQLSANEKVSEFKATAAFAQVAKEAGGIK